MSSDATKKRLSVSLTVGILAVAMATPISVWSQSAEPGDSPNPIPLRVGQVITTPQRADETVSYRFEVEAGQTYLIEVQQHGLDFIVTVEDPAGATQSYSSPLERDESEFVLIEPITSDSYCVAIHSELYTGINAQHSIHVKRLSLDSADVRAWRLMSQAGVTDQQGTPSDGADAAASYEMAAREWQNNGQLSNQAQALLSVAMLEYWQLENWDRSAEAAAAAAEIYKRLGDVSAYGRAIYVQGYALLEVAPGLEPESASSTFDRAFALLHESEQIFESLNDRRFDLAQVKNNIGYAYFTIGDWDSAIPYWEAAAEIYGAIQEWGLEVQPLSNLAVVAAEQGRLTAATEALDRILAVLPERLRLQRGTYLNNLGGFHRQLGNFDEALEAYSEALRIHEALRDEPGEGQSRVGLGLVYSSLGEFELAEELLVDALPVTKAANDYERQQNILRYLGNIAYERGQFESALERHRDALATYASAPDQARIETLISRDLRALGRLQEASLHAGAANSLAENAGASKLSAEALLQRGLAELALADYEPAHNSLEAALAIFERLNLRADQSDALNGLALVARARGDLRTALRYSERTLSELETARTGVSAPELRAFFSAQRRSYYETHLDILIDLHAQSSTPDDKYLRAALEIVERAKARMLTDLLAEASVDLDRNLNSPHLARRQELLQQLAELRYRRDELSETDQPTEVGERTLEAVIGEMALIENELNVIETERRGGSGSPASRVLTASEIQRLIDPGSILLQYALGDEASYVLVVESSRIGAVELPSRNVIEASARRVYENVHTIPRSAVDRGEARLALAELSELILRPVENWIPAKRLQVSLDGALQYIPFGALTLGAAATDYSPLLATHEIAVVPSMTATALTAHGGSRPDGPQSGTLAIFADAVFDANDPRLGGTIVASTSETSPPSNPITRSTSLGVMRAEGTERYLPRLASTGEEARSIAALVPRNQRLVATGLDASVRTVRATALGDYRFLHFATHGLIDSRYPALSALALSQFDQSGESVGGMLRLHDIYAMRLNADLVVLSACETALGREIRGEGLVGLTQGFLYAGARSLVVSLWQVPDRATAELMTRFYEYLLRDGLEPSDALRRAQVSVASESRWSDPYFWSAFVLMGSPGRQSR